MKDFKKDKKRFLLAGGLGSIHIYNLVKNVLCNLDYEIVAYNTTGDSDSIPPHYAELYAKYGITVINGRSLNKVGVFNYIIGLYNDFKKLGKFDIVNLHYVSHYVAPILYYYRKNFGKIIVTFWGSDLLRSSAIKRLATKPLLKRADVIQLMTDGMKQRFSTIPSYRQYLDKVKVLDFGDYFLDMIDENRDYSKVNKEAILNHFGLDTKLPIVTIGYVGRPEMQQIEVVQSILDTPELNKKSFQIALPVYGMNSEQLSHLESIMKKSGIKYRIFPDFMGEDDVVIFRLVTDIFIHPQTSDALSCSVVECFYSGSVIINGEWLNYSAIDNKGAYYHKFGSFEYLGKELDNVLMSLDKERQKSKINIDIMKSTIHWETLRPKWINMYHYGK